MDTVQSTLYPSKVLLLSLRGDGEGYCMREVAVVRGEKESGVGTSARTEHVSTVAWIRVGRDCIINDRMKYICTSATRQKELCVVKSRNPVL